MRVNASESAACLRFNSDLACFLSCSTLGLDGSCLGMEISFRSSPVSASQAERRFVRLSSCNSCRVGLALSADWMRPVRRKPTIILTYGQVNSRLATQRMVAAHERSAHTSFPSRNNLPGCSVFAQRDWQRYAGLASLNDVLVGLRATLPLLDKGRVAKNYRSNCLTP
jgi:hypothetical protein